MRPKPNHKADISYLLSLGSDATPSLIEKMDSLSKWDRCHIAIHAIRQQNSSIPTSQNEFGDLQWENRSESAASETIQALAAKLSDISKECMEFGVTF